MASDHGMESTPSDTAVAELRMFLEEVSMDISDLSRRAAEDLEHIRRRLGRARTSIAFGGLFNAGKSTLINSLLGREVLPTDLLPETGAIWSIRRGRSERGRLAWKDGRPRESRSVEELRQQTGLVDDKGFRRDEGARDIDRIELFLSEVPILEGVEWLDTPGIDDSKEMTEVAARAAEDADLLLWVLSSRHALTETEMAFLSNHAARCGTDGILFVLNLIAVGGGPEVEERLIQAVKTKIDAFWRELEGAKAVAPGFFPVDGLRLADERNDQGRALREFLAEFGRPARPAVAGNRIRRTVLSLERVRGLLENEREALIGHPALLQELCDARDRVAERAREEVRSALAEYVGNWRLAVETELRSATDTLRTTVIERQRVGHLSGDRFVGLAHPLHGELTLRLDDVFRQAGAGPLSAGPTADLCCILPIPTSLTCTIRPFEGVMLQGGRYAAIGAIGCLIGCIPGFLLGVIVGASRRPQERERMIRYEVGRLKAVLDQLTREIDGRIPWVQSRLNLAIVPEGPPPPDTEVWIEHFGSAIEAIDRCTSLACSIARGASFEPHAPLADEHSCRAVGNSGVVP